MNRRELFPTLGAGMAFGGLAAIVGTSHGCAPVPAPAAERIGSEIGAAIERHRAAGLAFDAADRVYARLDDAIRDRLAADPTAERQRLEQEAGFGAAEEAWHEAAREIVVALDALMAAPIATLADARAKAAHALGHGDLTHADPAMLRALLRSLAGDGQA